MNDNQVLWMQIQTTLTNNHWPVRLHQHPAPSSKPGATSMNIKPDCPTKTFKIQYEDVILREQLETQHCYRRKGKEKLVMMQVESDGQENKKRGG